jgi:hypothetical protein
MTMPLARRLRPAGLGARSGCLDRRGRLPERTAAGGTGRPGPRLARPGWARAAHRYLQQDHQPGIAPGLPGGAARSWRPASATSWPAWRRRRRHGPARRRGLHAGRSLPAPPAPHETRVCGAARSPAALPARRRPRARSRWRRRPAWRSSRGCTDASDVDVAVRARVRPRADAAVALVRACAARGGLLLGVTNVDGRRLVADCRRLAEIAAMTK